MTTDQKFFDLKQAAKVAGVGRDTLLAAIRTGALKAKRTSVNGQGDPTGKYVIAHAELDAWYDTLPDA